MFTGPKDAKVYLVFDYPFGETCRSFSSPTLLEAYKLLLANGINPNECRIAYASESTIKGRLMSDQMLTLVKDVAANTSGINFTRKLGIPAQLCQSIPVVQADLLSFPRDLVICFGVLAAQVLRTSHVIDSQFKWRGSMLDAEGTKRAMVTLAPADWMVDWPMRFLVNHDIRRAVDGLGQPWPRRNYRFAVAEPTLASVTQLLAPAWRAEKIGVDIETANGLITSIAIAWDVESAVCVPFVKGELDWYFSSPAEEARVIKYITTLLMKVPGVGQNYNYDRQYFARNWGIAPPCWHDTMGGQHVLLNSPLRKDLATLASMHCQDYIFWKDESKARVVGNGDDYSQWIYNCKDAAYTLEVAESQIAALCASGMFLQYYCWHGAFEAAYQTMLRGTRYDRNLACELHKDAERTLTDYRNVLNRIVPVDVHLHTGKGDWYSSPKALASLLYDRLGQTPVYSKQRTVTADSEAMKTVAAKEPLLLPLVSTILDNRRLAKSVSTYLSAKCDPDGRMRTMYQVAGPITYRLASQKTAFDTGLNLQNLSKGDRHAKERHNPFGLPFDIPSVKQLFIPDPDFYIIDVDLEQADARVVAWDSQSKYLMNVFNTPGADLHTENAKLIFSDPTIDKKHPMRQRAKAGVHAVNYRVAARTLAKTLGITVDDAQFFIDTWLLRNPEIVEWHNRLEWEVRTRGYVQNVFGYRYYFLDRESPTTMSEAASWNPQSTVAIYINLVWCRIVTLARAAGIRIDVLLQVHDSLVLQCRRVDIKDALALIKVAFEETICPYSHSPLVIAAGKPEISLRSWNDVKSVNWDLT